MLMGNKWGTSNMWRYTATSPEGLALQKALKYHHQKALDAKLEAAQRSLMAKEDRLSAKVRAHEKAEAEREEREAERLQARLAKEAEQEQRRAEREAEKERRRAKKEAGAVRKREKRQRRSGGALRRRLRLREKQKLVQSALRACRKRSSCKRWRARCVTSRSSASAR